MAVSENETERWPRRHGGGMVALVEPAAAPDSSHLSPVPSLGSADHVLHLPGRADSAYSSFSGSSNVPEYHTPSCYEADCCPAPEQVPYMDSEYVRGIYNLSAASSALRCLQPCQAPAPSIPGASHSPALAEHSSSTPPCGMLNQGLPPPAAPLPSPPARLDSYRIARHLESTKGRGRWNSGGLGECSAQSAPCMDRLEDVSHGQTGAGSSEPAIAAARRRALENKGPSSGSADGVSVSKLQGLRTEENGERSPSQKPVRRSNPHVYSRPSSFIFQEYLKTDFVANVPKILSAYGSAHAHSISEEVKPRSYPATHCSPGAAGEAQGDEQCPCSVRRAALGDAELRSAVLERGQWKGSLLCAQCPLRAELPPDVGQDVFEDVCDLKYTENALLIKNACRKSNSCTDKNGCSDYKGEIGSVVREPLLNPQAKMQKLPLSCSCDTVESEQSRSGKLDHGNKQCCDNTEQMASLRPKEDSSSQPLNEGCANSSSPGLNVHLEQEQLPVPYQKCQPELQQELLQQPPGDPGAEQITRQTTPMLYYLSGGRAASTLHHSKLAWCPEGARSSPKGFAASSHAAWARSTEMQRESSEPRKAKHRQLCADRDALSEAEDVALGSPASSTDESSKNDYREKLKVAQKKVLRETSFKRKDLQMSLPVRLRQKPSKRPSIEHLRSFSLSSAHEDAKPAPCSASHLESLEGFSRDAEIQRPQASRIGGRKRATKEEKKLCYSEPEKLDRLADREAPWNRGSDESTEQDSVAARRTAESRGRARSSSSISRTELKQIQHSALIEYMERKISQRPGSTQLVPPHKPPLQTRPSHPKWPPGRSSNHSESRKTPSNEAFFSEEAAPDVFPPPSPVPPPNAACGGGTVPAKPSPHPAAPDRSRSPERVSVQSLPVVGAAAQGLEAERPYTQLHGPSAACTVCCSRFQDADRCASCAASPARPCGIHLSTPSSHDPREDGCQSHEHKDSVAGSSLPQGSEELPASTSVLSPRNGSREDAQVEEKSRSRSQTGDALMMRPELQLKASGAAAAQGNAACCLVPPAQPQQGDGGTAPGWNVNEAATHSSRDGVLQEGGKDLPQRRLWSPEDRRYEELVMDLVAKDSSLVDVLMPYPVRKTALDLMEGLFPVNISMLEMHRRKADVRRARENEKSSGDVTEECPESELTAMQRSEDPTGQGNCTLGGNGSDVKDLDDITCKKLELISSLRAKVRALGEDRELVLAEAKECAERGEELEAAVRAACKPNEAERYATFIGDLEKVVSLLLCLSSRLARVQNAMRKVDGNTDAEEKQSLNERHKLLSRQREDAKDLKENLDRRERVVSGILAKYLSDQQLQAYRHFVQLKTSLLIEQKDLEEQIKFFEEQVENLEKSIPL
ncbi:protein Shroom1 isoform X2 [Numida meleagris]|uniref:protein Shroom1 isoform X2 n=1 Tax=Numida meleagris TaxID=8996 RepID=UPI000B3DE760|nr:protein Shroom1 isoform X2 [Numida meleagris]